MVCKRKELTIVAASLLLSINPTFASDDNSASEYHDADPRNSSLRAAVLADDKGEIKLLAGGGASGLTSDISQTVGFAEYYTHSNNARLRGAHFDRFGGAYVDIYHLDDVANMYTGGYMLPLSSGDGTLFFPSLNYTYVDFQTGDLAEVLNSHLTPVGGYPSLTPNHIVTLLDGDTSHLGSVNLYALHPWNDTHFSVFNINLGSSYSGVDMQMANLMWVQGIKTKVADKDFNILFELKYDVISVQNESYSIDETSEEVTASIGVDYRF
ncbi:hypothetical protein [Vibrio comitans]|uniref:Outer membrane protein beta-barrel domain-containing protein n=1 Tax=Vibrio comitans NBRC 102076 TaxID=1219078 RepID=A0A4Y3IPY4_9VIBR|nr:hypothetical protein [Vibrio comitans]GEA61135.1 hypothetical protein VCO01S_23280 [Vibrio comitans NBRC 102076]